MARANAVRVDEKGRLVIPSRLRREMGIEPGDILYLHREGDILCYAKAVNPFDALAEHAIKEYRAGRTRDLKDVAGEMGIDA